MSAQWTGKGGGKRYGSYVCQSIIRKGAKACPGSRVPAVSMEEFVVAKIRAVGRDPSVLTETVATARAQLATRGPEITKERQRLKDEKRRLDEEQERLAEAIAQGGEVAAVRKRLDKTTTALDEIATKGETLRTEAAALRSAVIDEADLRAAVAGFDGVWDHLLRDERQRLLRLLIEEVRYSAPSSELAITYDPEGVAFLALDREGTTP
jgi:site-specific DNA recombinase